MSQKTITSKSGAFGDIFDDSDEENEVEVNIIDTEIEYRFQEKYDSNIKKLRDFMNDPEYITVSGDIDTNIVDMYSMFEDKICTKSYNIPDNKIPRMFKFMELCRRDKSTMMIYEKQQEYSGIMLDFDIMQKSAESYMTDGVIDRICQTITEMLLQYINFTCPDRPYTSDKLNLYLAVIKKQSIKYNLEKKYYKDGLHILIPSIKVTREFKKFFIKKCRENIDLNKYLKHISLADDNKIEDIIDKNSAHVPVFFLGSSSKMNAPPYYLYGINGFEINTSDGTLAKSSGEKAHTDFGLDDKMHLDEKSKVVLCHELSLNWENDAKKNPIIEKRRYEAKEEYLNEINSMKSVQGSDEDVKEKEYGMLSITHIHDPDTEYIEGLLNTLNPSRYTDFDQWFKVLCVLAHTSASYKSLAETFSMKSADKYSSMDFEHHWLSASTNKKNKLNIGSLHFWAKQDNPVKYEEVRHRSIFNMVYKKIYDVQLEGSLQHYDIAKILHKSLRHKYKFDPANGGEWYEFILESDPQKSGEVFKWRLYNKAPASLMMYMSEILPSLFTKVFERIDVRIEEDKGDEIAKYNVMIKANLKVTCRKLRDHGFKTGVMRECEQVFGEINFTASLDKDVDIMGVGNGILKLGKDVQFITGYHNYMVSMHTSVNYIEFNPYGPITKKLLYALRNLFPDDEPDTYEFIMCYLASALDGKKKESLLMLLIGGGSNGKSFLMELFRETIGPYGVKMPLSFLTSRPKNSESATPALMMLMNARAANYSETDKNETLHLAKVKEITGQETMGGRKLHKDFENFKPKCHHIVTANYDFDTGGSSDHGTWRRLKRVGMKIKFCKAGVDDYSEENPNERIADPTMGTQWPDDPEVKSAFLSILCYYYEILQNDYKGIVENVPHPHVRNDTEEYRDRQDKINNFINMRFVKTVDPFHRISMATIIEKYTKWYDRIYPDEKDYKKSIGFQFENSKLVKIIKKERNEVFILGYRILDEGEEKEDDEKFFMDESNDKKMQDVKTIPETTDQFYSRICADYEMKKITKTDVIKREAAELHKKKMEAIKTTPKVIDISLKTNLNTFINNDNNETSKTSLDTDYDKSGFKKVVLTSLSKNKIKEFVDFPESDSDSSESSKSSGSDSD